MRDGARARRRILAVIAAHGGFVTSGQNDNFLTWFFLQVGVERRKHKRVTELEKILLAMEQEGCIELVYHHTQSQRIIGARLAAGADLEEAAQEQDIFDSPDKVWWLVAVLTGRIADLTAHSCDADAALELAATTEANYAAAVARRAELEQLLSDAGQQLTEGPPVCTHADELSQLQAELQRTRSRCDVLQARVLALTNEFAAFRTQAHTRYARDGDTIAALRRSHNELRLQAQPGTPHHSQ